MRIIDKPMPREERQLLAEHMQRWDAAQARVGPCVDEERASREVCDILAFWTVCEDRRCKRARACAGDLTPEIPHCYARLESEQQVWIRALSATFRARGSWVEAICAGKRAKDRHEYDEIIRELMLMQIARIKAQLQRLRARFGIQGPPPTAVAPGQVPPRALGCNAGHKVKS